MHQISKTVCALHAQIIKKYADVLHTPLIRCVLKIREKIVLIYCKNRIAQLNHFRVHNNTLTFKTYRKVPRRKTPNLYEDLNTFVNRKRHRFMRTLLRVQKLCALTALKEITKSFLNEHHKEFLRELFILCTTSWLRHKLHNFKQFWSYLAHFIWCSWGSWWNYMHTNAILTSTWWSVIVDRLRLKFNMMSSILLTRASISRELLFFRMNKNRLVSFVKCASHK